jgi:hypothetical protein
VFPALKKVDRLEDVSNDDYLLISIDGNTARRDNIGESLKSIERHNSTAMENGRNPIDRLLVCLDAEDSTYEDKLNEVESLISNYSPSLACDAIVHNCCLETWFLGNKQMMKRYPQSELLREWKDFYDVSAACPESMPCYPGFRVKAEFHLEYLKEMLRDRASSLTYSKYSPSAVKQEKYLLALVDRYETTGHIQSFGRLVTLWRSLNGKI